MTFFKITAFVGASMLAAPAAMAASILIDDFSDFQTAADLPTATAASPSFAMGSMLGGSRVFEVVNTTNGTVTPGSGGAVLTSTGNGQPFQQTPENTLIFATDTSQTGRATVIYDGRASLGGAPALPEFDLTNSGMNTKFFFELVQDTPNFFGTTLTTTVTDHDSSFAFVEDLDAGFSPFTEFSNFAGIDFSRVTSLAFTFDTNDLTGFDGGISSISAVPLPLSALLLLGGLGGLAGASTVSRRRRQKA